MTKQKIYCAETILTADLWQLYAKDKAENAVFKSDIFDVCVVVTRYFGGVLLGTGGLCYSYSSCCKEILKRATFARCCLCEILKLEFSYKNLNKIENIISAYNITKLEKQYVEDVHFLVVVEEKKSKSFENASMEATNGDVKITCIKKEWQRIRF